MDERRSLRVRQEAADSKGRVHARLAIALAAGVTVMLRLGWPSDAPLVPPTLAHIITAALIAAYAGSLLEGLWRSTSDRRTYARRHVADLGAVAIGVLLAFSWPIVAMAAGVIVVINLVRVFLTIVQSGRVPSGVMFVGSFIVFIVIGTGLLMLPAATPDEHPINLLDATFTITSATCQTGLVVRPTGESFTRFGHVVILIWIQVGALGVILFGALFAALLGSSFGLKATQTLAEPTESGWSGQLSLQKLVIFIVLVTHLLEVIGIATLYVSWPTTWEGAPPGMEDPAERLFHCVFFSVSSFCNAGFSTTSNSLEGLRSHWTSHFIIVPMIVIGSIGFPVLANLWEVFRARLRKKRVAHGALIRLNVNTKIILTTTGLIYIIGGAAIFAGELVQANQPAWLAVLDANFMVVNRTSGFDTIDPNEMGILSRLVLILLMFIGGSPGSVAGGIKVMCFAVLLLTVWSTIMGRSTTQVFGRTIPDEVVRKSSTLVVLCLVGVMTVAAVLAASESQDGERTLAPIIFEAVSAFGTTGYSMGITPDLSPTGRIAIIVAMFVGRVGPLATIAGLMSIARQTRARYSYPSEEVMIY